MGSSRWLRLDVYGQPSGALRSGQLGRWDARQQRIALCAAQYVRGSSAVCRLQVRVATFARMLVCVTGLGSGPRVVREQLLGFWFGPHGP